MGVYPGFLGDDEHFWDFSISGSDDCLPQRDFFTKRDNPVVQEQVSRRAESLGYFMMKVFGDLANSGKTFHDLYPRLVEGPEQSYTGWALNEYTEFWNALCYLTAPEGRRHHYWEESAFFLQLCGVKALLSQCQDSLMEEAPLCVSQVVDEATGEENYPVTIIDENGEEYHEVFRSASEWYKYFILDKTDERYDLLISNQETD